MPHAITQSCCADASCVGVCPVDCIHPRPDEPDFATAEMLYVDPDSCIDCGACADACPVDAVRPVELLRGPDTIWAEVNRDHFAGADQELGWDPPRFPAALDPAADGLRVAVVGTGPSACYTAAALLTTSAEVTMLDRLPVAGGLVRFGVAPDHLSTRRIADRFATVMRNPRLRLRLGVEVGRDVTHAQLLARHDAVVYAVGASAERRLGVAGEDRPGSLAARTVVGWYNGHPEVPADLLDLVDLPARRAVLVGNGNVSLDVARLLLSDPSTLGPALLADHARTELSRSALREVVVLGRRGPQDAAYSTGELRALVDRADLEVVVVAGAAHRAEVLAAAPGSRAGLLQGLPTHDPAEPLPDPPTDGRRRLVLWFGATVEEIGGRDRVASVRLATDRGPVEVATDLVLRSLGARGEPVADLPFDAVTGTLPHRAGRVVDAGGEPVPATYVVGWAKRGPRGGIGSNRADAAETVASLVADANAGRLARPGRAGRRYSLRSRT